MSIVQVNPSALECHETIGIIIYMCTILYCISMGSGARGRGPGTGGDGYIYMKLCRKKCEHNSWACISILLSGIKNTV